MFFVSLAACAAPAPGDPADTADGLRDSGGETGDSGGETGDSGGETGDSGGETAAPPWTGPELALQDCAGDSHTLADLVAGHDALVIGVGAGWCEPCQEDAPLLEDFAARHPAVAIASALVEDGTGNPATRLFCEEWVAAYGLTYPVLIDPLYLSEAVVDGLGFPVHVAWTADGTERYRASGAFDEAAILAALGG